MLNVLALANEELQLYTLRVLIARELHRRATKIERISLEEHLAHSDIPVPPDDVLDFLREKRQEGLPRNLYEQENQYREQNIERFIQLAVRDSVSNVMLGKPKLIPIRDGVATAISYEDDPKSPILYVRHRIKRIEKLGIKSLINSDTQDETGYCDQMAIGPVVESLAARDYRTGVGLTRLDAQGRTGFSRAFNGKSFEQLSPEERHNCFVRYAVRLENMADEERAAYRSKFESLHNSMCINLAEKIALQKGFDTIPIKPHYMRLDDLDLRVQRQFVVDHNEENALEFEYILRRGAGAGGDLFERVLASASGSVLERQDGYAQYLDHQGRISYLFNHGALVINFHSHGRFDESEIKSLFDRIRENYGTFREKFEEEKKEGDTPDSIDSRVLQAMRLGMDDIPAGFGIFAETTKKDTEAKYHGMYLDTSRASDMFIKDRSERSEQNQFRDVKLYIALRPRAQAGAVEDTKSFGAEVQIRDPIMEYESEFGSAAGYHDPEEYLEIKAQRSPRPVKPLTQEDKQFVAAFFRDDEASKAHLSKVYASFYQWAILNSARQISGIGSIPTERTRFEDLFERIELLFDAARHTSPNDLENVVSAVKSLMPLYVKSRRFRILSYQDDLVAINDAMGQASEEFKVDFGHFRDINGQVVKDAVRQVIEYSHETHIAALYESFVNLVNSGDTRQLAASFFVARLIRNYNKRYDGGLSEEIQMEYAGKISGFWEEKERGSGGRDRWAIYKFRPSTAVLSVKLGHVPAKYQGIGKRDIDDAVRDPTITSAEPSRNFEPLQPFSSDTLLKLKDIYRGVMVGKK